MPKLNLAHFGMLINQLPTTFKSFLVLFCLIVFAAVAQSKLDQSNHQIFVVNAIVVSADWIVLILKGFEVLDGAHIYHVPILWINIHGIRHFPLLGIKGRLHI